MTIAPPELIGLSGYSGSGKDTVATILATCAWQRAAFADPLREALYRLNPCADEWSRMTVVDVVDNYGWDTAKRHYPELRILLQRMGTEVGREMFGDNFWVDLAMREPIEQGGRWAFTDCRFVNEADAIRNAGGKVWRIEHRPTRSTGHCRPTATRSQVPPAPSTPTSATSATDPPQHSRRSLSHGPPEMKARPA